MRHQRTWIIAAAAIVVTLAVGALLALPVGVRVLAERRAEALTGRRVTIDDVDLNLFTRHLVARDIRVHAGGGETPPLTVRRLEAWFRLVPLFRGRVHLYRLALDAPDVYVQRTAPQRFNISDVLAHLARRPSSTPIAAVVDTLTLRGGRVRLDDEAVDPARYWRLADVALEARDVVTSADIARGRASARFVLAGAPGVLEAERVGVHPPQARVSLELDGLELGRLGAYFPAGAPVRISDGQLSATLMADYDATGALHASGEVRIGGLAFSGRGPGPPVVTVPDVLLIARDLEYAGGDLAKGHLEVAADRLTVLDVTAPRARPLDVTALHLTWEARPRALGPMDVRAVLPGGGELAASGSVSPRPLAADVRLEVKDLDVGLAQQWLPPDARVAPVGGRLFAGVDLSYTGARGLVAGGEVHVADLAIARVGQDTPLMTDDRVVAHVRGLRLGDGATRLEKLEVESSPTIVDASVSPPRRLHVPRVGVVAEHLQIGSAPAQVRVGITLPHEGHLTADGTLGLAPTSLALDVRADDVDLGLGAPYIPAGAAVTIDRGRLDGRLKVTWDDGWHGDGRLVARDLTLLRRGQAEPLLHHPSLTATITGLAVRDGELSLDRLALAGSPTIVDATASPPQRFDVRTLSLIVTELTWPGRRPAQLQGSATLADGGRGELTGTLDVATLAADVEARFEDIDIRRAAAYVPAGVPLAIDRGRAEATVRVRHRRGDGVILDGSGALRDFELTVAVGSSAHVRGQQLDFSLDDLRLRPGALSLARATVESMPVIGRAGEAGSALSRLHAALRGLRWPTGPDAHWDIVAEPADGGRLTARGTVTPSSGALRATVQADDAAIRPFAAFVPIEAPVSGRVDGSVRGATGGDHGVALDGDVTVRDLAVGPSDAAPVRIGRVAATGITLRDGHLAVARVDVERPSVVVERADDGSFPLRAMLTPAPSPAASPGDRPSSARPAAEHAATPALSFTVDELALREGNARFIDHTTTPFYSEELSRLAVTLHGLTSAGDARARVAIQGIVGVDAALDLHGQVAPFATPFFLDVAGELRDFSIPRTNPYLQRLLDWIARRGELATEVHYHIEGDRLTATNEIVVQRLDVERAKDEDRSERLVGLPLGLVVALLKDARGNIHVTVPVSGQLGSPHFSFGDAMGTALRNVITRLLTGPFRAIGSVLRRHGTVEEVGIEPVIFSPTSAVLTPDAAAHLQRVADFLRTKPYVTLTMRAVITDADVRALRVENVTARIQQLQRDEGLADFDAAARRLWRRIRGDVPAPDTTAIAHQLAEIQAIPPEAERALANRRLGVTRTYLAESAGVQPERSREAGGPPVVGGAGDGRVDFALQAGAP